jgi:Large ribosomal RNA subunit accumulation protein YceD
MPLKTSTPADLTWDYATREIPDSGLSRQREAAPDELARIVRTLDLVACNVLRAEYTIKPSVAGRYRLAGSLHAEITQACVVTLEPVVSTIEEGFDVTFWPQEDIPAPESGAVDLDDEPEPEPIVAGQIAVGRVVFETLAAAIDPFPRKPDASLDRHETAPPGVSESKPESPFAVLANIKPKG